MKFSITDKNNQSFMELYNQREKLVSSLKQIDNIVELTNDNEWKTFLYQHLSSISCELNRQLSILDSEIPKEINRICYQNI